MEKEATVIALTGKGGVGKTTISATIVRLLTEAYPDAKILAIDADPAIGLSIALGAEVKETLDDIRQRVADDVTGKLQDTQDILAEAKFRIFEAIEEQHGFAFLAIGRPESAGCYCAINTYLREVIGMLVKDFDYVVIDGEAGIEQINRRVMDKVTHLLCVSDQSRRGLQIIGTIKNVADGLVMYDKAGLILNRAAYPEKIDFTDMDGIPVVAVIGPDETLAENDIEGESVFELPEDCNVMKGTRKALENIGIL